MPSDMQKITKFLGIPRKKFSTYVIWCSDTCTLHIYRSRKIKMNLIFDASVILPRPKPFGSTDLIMTFHDVNLLYHFSPSQLY